VEAAAAGAAAAASGGAEATPAVLVMGDFNAVPGSPACKELEGHPGLHLQSIWTVPWAADSASTTSSSNGGKQQQQAPPPPAEFSTWKFRPNGEARRTIDHLYFSPAQLAATKRWRMLTPDEIGAGGLPCARYPSDHMALACEFEWV
jgi:endonuclease/exonuclease/phosphatase family metal-dependent hydrolase